MRRFFRLLWVLLLLGAVTGVLTLTVSAENTDHEAVTMPSAYGDLETYIPPEMADLLPDGLFSENAE